jgi:galactose-1-phosphate uridylyltransferase
MVTQQLTRETLNRILEASAIEALTFGQITDFFLKETGIAEFAPDGVYQIDPRNGDRIVFNSARARRPHDNRPTDTVTSTASSQKECVICQGRTTHVIDIAGLSEGFTFINKNLFPIFYPDPSGKLSVADEEETVSGTEGLPSYGLHFLQWTSSLHDKDWQNMPQGDRVIALQRLAALEKKLITEAGGYVSMIKNYGHLVGGSLAHGHQQIGFSNIIPRRFRDNLAFKEKYGETFSAYLLQENPSELLVQDYGPAVLLVPYFMRRPYDMYLLIKDTGKQYLHELNAVETAAVADGWRDAIRIMLLTMPQIGRETAYNVTTHNGPGAGLYFEFLPYTQEMGGFEHLGLYLCQGNPKDAAAYAKKILTQNSDNHFQGVDL